MKSHRFLSIALSLVLLVSSLMLTACAPQPQSPTPGTPEPAPESPTPTEVIRWRMYQITASTAVGDLERKTWTLPANYLALADELKERTNGRLEIQVMTPAELGFSGAEILRALDQQLVEVAQLAYTFYTGEIPWLGISDVPFSYSEPYVGQWEAVQVLRPYCEDLATEYGHKLIHLGRDQAQPYLAVYSKKPINTVSDLEGLKIRIYNVYQEGFLKAAGASPVFMAYAEVPMALAQGTIDAVFTSVGLGHHIKAVEGGIKYETCLYPGFLLSGVGVSNKAFDALPEDLKPVATDVFEWYDVQNTAHVYNGVFGRWMMQQDMDDGIEIRKPDDSIVEPLREYAKETSWKEFLEDSGPMGEEVLTKMLALIDETPY